MNAPAAPVPAASPAPRRHRIWPWIVALFLTPFVFLAAVVLSFVTLDSDAAALRRNVAKASGADWHTKVQLSIGRVTLGAVRTGLLFAHDNNAEDARLALGAVQGASVGVYELGAGETPDWSGQELFSRTDRVMLDRGWTRIVGVIDHKNTVLVYAPTEAGDGDDLKLCVAVVDGRNLVVVSTTIEPEELNELIDRKVGTKLKDKLHLAMR